MGDTEQTYHLYLKKNYGGYVIPPPKIKYLCNKNDWFLKQYGCGGETPRDVTIPQTFTNCKECLLVYWDKKDADHQKLKFMMIDKGVIEENHGN